MATNALLHMHLFKPAQEVDPRYINKDFRETEAQRYIDYLAGKVKLTKDELQLIPRQCYHEIQDICWNGSSTVIGRAIDRVSRVCDPFFSRLPDDGKNAVIICGASMISLGAILFAASHPRNDKLVVIAIIFFIAVLCSEMYRKTLTKE